MKYFPLRHCQRSNKTQIGVKNVKSVEKCAQFAEVNKAMAFNYGHGNRPRNKTADGDLINLFDTLRMEKFDNETKFIEVETYFNCQVLSCPETGNLSTMINDTRFDYYSLYVRPIRK